MTKSVPVVGIEYVREIKQLMQNKKLTFQEFINLTGSDYDKIKWTIILEKEMAKKINEFVDEEHTVKTASEIFGYTTNTIEKYLKLAKESFDFGV